MTGVDTDLATLRERLSQGYNLESTEAALARVEAELSRLREERDAALRGNWEAEPDEEGGKSESYWLRNKLRSAVVHLRDVEDFYRVRSSRLGSHNDERASRARGIYEQISEDFINGKLGTPTMRARAEAAEAMCARLQQALADVREARRMILSACIAVKGKLDQPYPDDDRWTPWTRFVEPALHRLDEALAGPDTPAGSQEGE